MDCKASGEPTGTIITVSHRLGHAHSAAHTGPTLAGIGATHPAMDIVHPIPSLDTNIQATSTQPPRPFSSLALAPPESLTAHEAPQKVVATHTNTLEQIAVPVEQALPRNGDTIPTPDGVPQTSPAPAKSIPEIPLHAPTTIPTVRQPSQNGSSPPVTISKHQQKHIENVLSRLLKTREAEPFRDPVDPVAHNVPDYLNVIKEPMDLGTIDRRLRQRGIKPGPPYTTIDEFARDVRLVFKNCYTYNGDTHPVSALASKVSDLFENAMAALPPEPPIGHRGSRQNSTSASVATPPSTSSTAAVGPVAYPEVVPLGQVAAPAPPRAKPSRRSGTGLKLAKPLGATDVPERRSRRDIITITQLKFCKEVLDYIYRPEFETWAYPFMSPVDLQLYPTYMQYVRHPMDLMTIQDKLAHNQYMKAEEFWADFKLMFNNCYNFNPPGTTVWSCGKELEREFDKRWQQLPTAEEIEARARETAHARGDRKRRREGSEGGKKRTVRRKRTTRPASLSDAQKFAMIEKLPTLKEPIMEEVIEIIRDGMPELRDNTTAIELEFENVPEQVLVILFEYLFPGTFDHGEETDGDDSMLSDFSSLEDY